MQQPFDTNDPEVFATSAENQYFDRKSARKDEKEIAKHLSAFANASGGKLVIGIEDDGEITGFKRSGAHDIESFEQAPLVTCSPVPDVHMERIPVRNSQGEDDFILVLDIEASTNRVITRRSDGEVFLRQQDRSVRLDREQVLALEYDKNQRRYEDEVCDYSSSDDVDEEVMDRYRAKLGTDAGTEQILHSRGMLADGHLTNAGVLLFSRNPTQFIPCARVRFLRIEGTELRTGSRMNIVKDRTFDGPLPKTIEDAKAMISSQLREFQYLGDDGKFKVVPEYPEFAWFEGLVNAVTHRDYAMSGDYIRVMMYDDRLVITSPGKLPNIVTLENMRNRRWSRNPKIARTLVEFGWVRELNEGVQRIYDDMAASFLHEPIFEEPDGISMRLTLENSITSRRLRQTDALAEQLGQDAMDGLSEYEIAAVQYLYGNGRVRVGELAEYLERSRTTASRILRSLEGKDIVVWHGTSKKDPSQYYTLRSSQ